MSHFYLDSRPLAATVSVLPPAAPGVAVKVVNVPEHGAGLVIMPTKVPLVRPGTPLVLIDMEFPILVPYLDVQGKYRDVRETGVDRKQFPKNKWYISAHTIDPDHILVSWDGETSFGAAGRIVLVSS